MDMMEFYNSIPRGKNDPPILLADSATPFAYDFHEPDSQYVMFDRNLQGCLVLAPFSKTMVPGEGKAVAGEQNLYCTIGRVKMAGFDTYWAAVRVGSVLHEYNKEIEVTISGFKDTDGNDMIPATVKIKTGDMQEKDAAHSVHYQTALEAAREGIVLLKNDNEVLPLKKTECLNLFGSDMFVFRSCAVGAGKINPRFSVSLLEAAKEENCSINEDLINLYAEGRNKVPPADIMKRASEKSDTAIYLLSRVSGENTDNSSQKGEYCLTDEEETLIRSLSEAFNHVVLILNVGYPMDLSFMDTCKVDAVLYTGFGGMYGGKAIMDVLLGRYNPSGRLPDTWAFHYDSIPSSKNFYDCRDGKKRLVTDEDICWVDTVYEEDIYVGYRYFETFKNADRRGYPFGYGLSYTSFDRKLKDLSFDSTGVSFSILVTNTGDREGSDVVQIYVSKPETLLEQPVKELVEYEKTASLKPGEGQQLDFFIPVKRLSSFLTDNAQYVISKGTYTFFEGNNVSDCRKIADYTVEENQEVKNVKNLMSPMKQIKLLTKKAINLPDGSQSGIMEGRNGIEPQKSYSYREIPEIEKIEEKEKITFADLQEDHTLLDRFIGGLSLEELARISVCGSHGWTVDGLGEAGRLATIDGLLLPNMVVADGNSGVNLKTKNVGMPSGVTLCASFNKKLMERVGSVIGKEAKELGINLILAPALNIHRNPLNGRHPEYFSEDPFLAGTMAGNYCKGLESTGVGGCYKHLLANNAESSRKRNQSILSERALREIYFKAFEYALEIHEPVSIMTAYNAVNGKFASCDEELIQGLLYEENGFEGFVMTDWTSYDSANVQEMVAAGNAWITPGSTDNTYTDMIVEGVNEKKISLGRLQDNVRRIIKALLWLNKETN